MASQQRGQQGRLRFKILTAVLRHETDYCYVLLRGELPPLDPAGAAVGLLLRHALLEGRSVSEVAAVERHTSS